MKKFISLLLLLCFGMVATAETATFNFVFSNAYTRRSPSGASEPERLEAVQSYIEGECGVCVNSIIYTDETITQQLNMLLADGGVDVFYSPNLGKGGSRALYELGITEDLAPYLDKYPNIKNLWLIAGQTFSDTEWERFTMPDGAIVAIPASVAMSGCCIYVRKDWLEALNLEVPTTTEELEACFAAVLEADLAGNGETIPLLYESGSNGYQALAAGFTGMGWGNYYITDENKVDLYANLPGMKDFLATMADWYSKGYIYKEYAATANDRNIELIKSGRVFAYAGWHSRVTSSTEDLLAVNESAEFIPLMELKGPAGTYARTMGSANDDGYVFVKGSKNIDAALAYIDWEYASLDNYNTALYGIKGEDWTEGVPGEIVDVTLGYVSEAFVADSFAFTMQTTSSALNDSKSYWYYANMLLDADRSVSNNFADVEYLMNTTDMSDETPSDDISRMLSEEYVKFIMGERPIDEYEQFQEELKKAGSEKVLDYLTERYNEAVG